mgnify:CR=1 FL=1
MKGYEVDGYCERYFINGWEEGRSYFFSVGSFTPQEVNKMKRGETVTYNGNEFRIERTEDE